MLKKRLAGVITVKGGLAVQSFGYRRHLPLGRPECLAENLDRWGADEIIVMSVDRTRRGGGPDLSLIKSLGALGLSTPLTYGGGVHTVAQAAMVIESGAERICLDAALHGDPASIREMAALVGTQALIAAMPVSILGDDILWYDYISGRSTLLATGVFPLLAEGPVSEVMLIDWRHEGTPNAFDMRLVEKFPFKDIPIIAFGGLSERSQLASLLAMPLVSAVAVGNFLSYSEHALQHLRPELTELPLRPAIYASAD